MLRGRHTTVTRHSALITFSFLLLSHGLAAFYAPIQDCDEVYNYWEPTHYLTHGYGLQTWEYSPAYAIRSWLYISLHAAPMKFFSFSRGYVSLGKHAEFYYLRALLAVLAASCETRLYNAVAVRLNPRVAILYAIITASSTGSFIATTSYLPSTFAMYTVTLAMSAFLRTDDSSRSTRAMAWLAVGAIVGWPFIALLSIPLALEDIYGILFTFQRMKRLRVIVAGASVALGILAIEICIDSVFYRKLTCVPFNNIYYNVFSGSGRGPDIYGTEPWDFYLYNLVLNFNIWLPLSLCTAPLIIGYKYILGVKANKPTTLTSLIITAPTYLWLIVMSSQAHKEERFMYPIYPCLALNGALSMHMMVSLVSKAGKDTTVGRIPALLKAFALASIVCVAAMLGIWRSAGLATAYGAPLHVYKHLENVNITKVASGGSANDINVCIGKEWYRFPSSYHLPSPPSSEQTFRLGFVASAFHGLLPGDFAQERADRWLDSYPGTWTEPADMNDQNIEDPGKVINIDDCDFLVDLALGSTVASKEEPDYVGLARRGDTAWHIVTCERFLDQTKSGILGKIGWLPDWLASSSIVPALTARRWGSYCLLQRKQ